MTGGAWEGAGLRARLALPAEAAALLRGTALFGGVDDDELSLVAAGARWIDVPRGETAPRAGQALYVVARGRFQLAAGDGRGGERPVDERGPGESFGEAALLADGSAPAAARALRDAALLQVSRAAVVGALERSPELALRFARRLAADAGRVGSQGERGRAATIAVVPVGAGAPTRYVAACLAESLATLGRTLVVDEKLLDEALGDGAAAAGEDDEAHQRAAEWLAARERENAYVVLAAVGASSAWTRRCLRMSDRVLAVALGGPSDGAALDLPLAHSGLDRGPSGAELVLVHGNARRAPSGTAQWLAHFPFAAHHHVRPGNRGDFDRLARRLAGRAFGLVLGGGGARAFAHVGVLRAFAELGFPVDYVGGSSLGAVIGAQYAAGADVETLLEPHRRWAGRRGLAWRALVDRGWAARELEDIFGARRIEDLWIPFFCVSTNLTRADVAVHDEGPLTTWLRASCAMPGIVPPVVTPSRELLVDGAVLENLPVLEMRRRCVGTIVAVDVAGVRDGGMGASPFGVLRRAALASTLRRARRDRAQADLHLAPPVDCFGGFEWRAIDLVEKAGYRYAAARVAEWQLRGLAPRGARRQSSFGESLPPEHSGGSMRSGPLLARATRMAG
ncbi:MAG: cyclic nucleotide-binding and patatin-like phospholipase domain-containing protein [Gemmatimonadaceae bacterium]